MTQLELCFAPNGAGRTLLAQRRSAYPYSITAPIARPNGTASLTLQSISGGLYGGEQVAQHIRLRAGARARLVQPAATTVRRKVEAGPARQSIKLEVQAGASLIYEARPLIMLPGAALIQDWEIRLSPGARVIVWDGFLSHSPHGEAPDWRLASRVSIRAPEGRLLAGERMNAQGMEHAPFTAFGKIWCLGLPPEQEGGQPSFSGQGCILAGFTRLPGETGFTLALAARNGGALSEAMAQTQAWLEQTCLKGDMI
ncbi:urease accessory protein UreD [Acidocella sp.]|uniref:urease accessory protein UreD n=1 Tax=Acidocella sp. TaxID=50710 RepID=UPI003D05D308